MNTNYFVPMVIESSPKGERAMDLRSRLMQDRIIMLDTDVNEQSASIIIQQLLYLESQSNDDIHFYVNSPGGAVSAGLGIYDTMEFIKPDVSTIVVGSACSMGSFLAQAGSPGKRFVLPQSRTMIHRVSSGTQGTRGSVHVQDLQFEDATRHFNESKYLNKRLTELYVKHNSKGKTYEELFEAMKFDTFLSAEEALEYGLCDQILTKRV